MREDRDALEMAAKKLSIIKSKEAALATALDVLERVNKWGAKGQVWKPSLLLHKDSGWGGREVSVAVPIPFGVIQQAALNEVHRCRRELIQAGGLDT